MLLGPNRVERLPGLGWSPRETAYLVHLLKIGGITFVLIAAFVLTVGTMDYGALTTPGAPIDPDLARRQALAAPLGAGFMVSVLLALRVSYGLAATAVDVPFSPRLLLGPRPRQRLDDHRHAVPDLLRRAPSPPRWPP